jgi:hypothetical protein
MKICRITLDLAYEDSARGAPKTERTLRNLIDKTLDPVLGEYMTYTSGVLVKHVEFPDPTPRDKNEKRLAWFRHAEQQLALLDIERFAVTHAVSTPIAVQRVGRNAAKRK